MSVGFAGFSAARRRTIRAPVNPMDKSTIVSVYPKEIDEVKHTIQPGRFYLAGGSVEKPSILVVGPSSWWKEVDEEQPLLEIPNSSIQVADSIVKDYCNGLLGCNMRDSMPGIFWVPGEFTLTEIRTKHKTSFDNAVTRQRTYYQTLVKLADGLWAQTNGNPLTISDTMRLAAKELQLVDKEWMKDHISIGLVRCNACGALKNPDYPVCGTCKSVDMSHPKSKDLKFAQ